MFEDETDILQDQDIRCLEILENHRASNQQDYEKETFGQKIANKVSYFVGSWKFIISQVFFIAVWAFLGQVFKFDTYPYVFLNLVLGIWCASVGTLIMMSQNVQDERDRKAAKKDYHTNLKAELEIELIHKKLNLIMDKLKINDEQVSVK